MDLPTETHDLLQAIRVPWQHLVMPAPLYPLFTQHQESYPGDFQKIEALLLARKQAVLEQKAILNDNLFALHGLIRRWVHSEWDEQHKVDYVKSLKNKQMAFDAHEQLLATLYRLYRCLHVEPAVSPLPDGERVDPTHFHIVFIATTDVSEEEAQLWPKHWMTVLTTLEQAVKQFTDGAAIC